VRRGIGDSELNGAQHWGSALEYGKKAGERAAAMGDAPADAAQPLTRAIGRSQILT
jgi:hypothetical protein